MDVNVELTRILKICYATVGFVGCQLFGQARLHRSFICITLNRHFGPADKQKKNLDILVGKTQKLGMVHQSLSPIYTSLSFQKNNTIIVNFKETLHSYYEKDNTIIVNFKEKSFL